MPVNVQVELKSIFDVRLFQSLIFIIYQEISRFEYLQSELSSWYKIYFDWRAYKYIFFNNFNFMQPLIKWVCFTCQPNFYFIFCLKMNM